MDIMEFLCVMIPIIIMGALGFRWIAMKDAANRFKAQKEARISEQNRKAAQMRGNVRSQQQIVDSGDTVGAWVPDLLEGFGIDPDVIFEDEMPEEVRAFLPIVKGYVSAQGGLPRIAANLGAGAKGQQQQLPDEFSENTI